MTDTNHKNHILVVEDEAVTRTRITAYFEAEGYQVSQSEDGANVRRIVSESNIDVVLLDINLPRNDGLLLARELRENTDVGIILVTARSDDVDKIVGLEIGADDYVTKPFNPRELLARVKSLIRRTQAEQQAPDRQRLRSFSGWSLDVVRRCLISSDEQSVPLTRGEFELLSAFLDHPNETLHRERLMDRVTHRSWNPNDRIIDVLVRRLRNKIEKNPHEPAIIITVYGEGYMLASDAF
ncbi:MAG: two-component system response regulator TorR [Gammaproteobacteria bacterium]